MLTPKQSKALQALLTQPTKAAAAEAAGISPRTLRDYLNDQDFQTEYKKAVYEILQTATRQAQMSLSPAIIALRDICESDDSMQKPGTGNRIAAARTLLEYGLKMTEITDILSELEAVEGE